MNERIRLIKAKAKDLLEEPYLCDETRDATNLFLISDYSKKELAKYNKELKDGLLTLDEGIEFVESGMAAKLWGDAVEANNFLQHCRLLKAQNEVYCDCSACAKSLEIIKLIEEN